MSLAGHRWTKFVTHVYHNVSRASVAVPVVRIGCDHKRQLQQHKQSQLKHWWQPALAMVGAGIFSHIPDKLSDWFEVDTSTDTQYPEPSFDLHDDFIGARFGG